MIISFARTIILYFAVILAMRVMGKRQIGELQPFELVVTLMLSDLAAVPMQETGIPLLSGLVPICALLILEKVLDCNNLIKVITKHSFIRVYVSLRGAGSVPATAARNNNTGVWQNKKL